MPDFRIERERIDVTSRSRPNTSWRYVDAAGHEHAWYVGGQTAQAYDPSARHELPTLRWVIDGYETYEDDDEPHEVGHYECAVCGERIRPATMADTSQQYIAGLASFYVDGQRVTKDEYDRRVKEAERTPR